MAGQWEELEHGVVRVDTGYLGEGIAACYLLEHRGEFALIETGVSTTLERLQTVMAAREVAPDSLKYIIPTHVHLDHAGCAGRMMAAFPEATLVIHPRGARHMISPEKLVAGAMAVYGEQRFSELYGEIIPVAEERMIVADDGFQLSLNGRELLFRDAPGHANHHFVVWDQQSEGWFTGDTFGISYPAMHSGQRQVIFPSTTPVQFAPDKLIASIEMMMSYEPKYAYLTHYGRVSGLEGLAVQLKIKVRQYCEIARRYANVENPLQYIEEALTALELESLSAFEGTLPRTEAQSLLAVDMELNAQGLLHWAQQQE